MDYIAGIQAEFSVGDIDDNLKKIREFVKESLTLNPDVKLLLFPELAATGYFLTEHLYEVAEKQGGPIELEMAKLAREYHVHLAYGYVEKGEENILYNSLKFIDTSGNSLGNYRKIHLTCLEKAYFSAGNEIVIVDTTMGKVGLMICWDLAFPELARELAKKGADLLLAPSAWEVPYDRPYHHFGRARAIDNSLFLMTINHIGSSQELTFFGGSCVYGPNGECLTMASDQEEILITAINQKWRKELKKTFFTMLEERRTDVYGS
ncbi:carbon-nitrogen hydrolase family protein [Halalkalibacter alkalisediminis]|uniref:Carbon-nitrogen hydrolase family protein n=1 Tax=Halalkalibacter alkalisediminis TaxID=935616 RepID=A0ABV6NIU8_9BACI|nr:carbon-nitrogen hydrolase family protein [Halalkalibacter alkalisediminis]